MRKALLALALMLAACGQGSGRGTNQDAMQAWVGRNLAEVTVQTLDGKPQPFKDLVKANKPVVLNVWASWCSPCLKEMPTLDALGKAGTFEVVAVSTDRDSKTAKTFLAKQAWGEGMTVWLDPWGSVTRKELGAVGIPVTYVLNPSLTVVMVEAGERDWNHPKMVAKMEKALAK
jgi:thiol-disulfide isomerase/thioredoxin